MSVFQKIGLSLANLLIGIVYGYFIFSLVPMWFGLFGAILVPVILWLRPKTSVVLMMILYWVGFSLFLFVVTRTGATWLIEPFKDLDYFRTN